MRARLFRFDEDGQAVGKPKYLEVYFPSSSKPFTINITVDYQKGITTEVEVPLKQLLSMILGMAIDSIFRDAS